jgi:hypothetical protein
VVETSAKFNAIDDAFANMSVAPPVEEAPAPAAKIDASKYHTGETVIYTSSGGETIVCTILKVHLDHELDPFYTITLPDGREKQTDDAHLTSPNTVSSQISKMLSGLSPMQLKEVLEFITKLKNVETPVNMPQINISMGMAPDGMMGGVSSMTSQPSNMPSAPPPLAPVPAPAPMPLMSTPVPMSSIPAPAPMPPVGMMGGAPAPMPAPALMGGMSAIAVHSSQGIAQPQGEQDRMEIPIATPSNQSSMQQQMVQQQAVPPPPVYHQQPQPQMQQQMGQPQYMQQPNHQQIHQQYMQQQMQQQNMQQPPQQQIQQQYAQQPPQQHMQQEQQYMQQAPQQQMQHQGQYMQHPPMPGAPPSPKGNPFDMY